MSALTTYVNRRKMSTEDGEFTFLNNVSSTIKDLKIRVRISRMWDTLNIHKKKELISTDMVLIDEKRNYIHASIGRNTSHRFKSILTEGKTYTIKNFEVSKKKDRFPVVENHPSMLQFYATTVVKEIAMNDNSITRHIFEFVDFEDLQHRCDKEVLTDVFGIITGVSQVEEKRTAQGQVDTLTIELQDKREKKIRVTIRDEYVCPWM